MTVVVNLASDVENIIAREIASGRFTSRDDVIGAGVRLLRVREEKLSALRATIQEGVDDIEHGRYEDIMTQEDEDRLFERIVKLGDQQLARTT